MNVATTAFVADWLTANWQIRTDRPDMIDRPLSDPTRADRLRDMLEQAGAVPDPAYAGPGVGERLDISV